MPIKSRIRTVPDFPKKGIMFRDVTSLIADPLGLKLCVDDFARYYKDTDIDLIVGIDSRGFIARRCRYSGGNSRGLSVVRFNLAFSIGALC